MSEDVSKLLSPDIVRKLRETSLLEALYTMSKKLKIHWSSQEIVKVDIKDRDFSLELFRKMDDKKDEFEDVFRDSFGVHWVKVLTARRKYVLRPNILRHIYLSQFSSNYK